MRLIDADLLKDGLRNLKARGTNINYVKGLQDAVDDYLPQIIDDVPTIDAEPVKHAYWVDIKFSEGVFKDNDDSDDIGISITSAKCSLCQRYSEQLQQYSPHMPAYCSHCGAKMDGGTDNENY
jgi:hypothetical protein